MRWSGPILGGCTWVPLTDEGARVHLANAAQVTRYIRRGRVATRVASKIGVIPRSTDKVREELATLARNEAVHMGGDTVVPETAIQDGRRVFGVYACAHAP